MSEKIIPVVMCGGAGSRLWPASRETYPKQFLTFGSGRSLLQDTLDRVSGEIYDDALIVTGQDHRFLVAEQVRSAFPRAQIVLEPARRDSCAAAAAAAALAVERDPDAMILLLAADHAISDPVSFNAHVDRARAAAEAGHLVTFGIRPGSPATGYGYIMPGERLASSGHAHSISAFVEKPDRQTAERYLTEGYLWNSGNFLFRASVFLAELARLAPDIHGCVIEAVASARRDTDFLWLDPEAFLRARATSIDYAVMEKTARAAVIPSDFPWSDIGAWSAVWDLAAKDANGNSGFGDAFFHSAENCYVHAPDVLTAVVGLKDVVVVTTRDAVLVVDKARSEDVKQLVSVLAGAHRREAVEDPRGFRPWGDFEWIERSERYRLKRLTVRIGEEFTSKSNLQYAEHWVVLSGSAHVTINGEQHILNENQSIPVPLGALRTLGNAGSVPLEVIAIRTGSNPGMDEIVRHG